MKKEMKYGKSLSKKIIVIISFILISNIPLQAECSIIKEKMCLDYNENNISILKDEIVDQSVPMGSCGFYNTYVAQSFRPTLNSLTRVEIPLFKLENSFGTVKLSIRERLYSADLTSKTLSVDRVPIQSEYDWVEFDFEDIEVKSGQKYYIVFTLNDGKRPENSHEWVFWIMSLNNPYLNGKPYQFYRYIWLPLWLLYPQFPDCSFKTYGMNN